MPLTDTAVKKAKPGLAPMKLSDGKGMYLLVNPPDGHPNSPTCGHLKFPHPERGVTMG
jgi:hypothetical protein